MILKKEYRVSHFRISKTAKNQVTSPFAITLGRAPQSAVSLFGFNSLALRLSGASFCLFDSRQVFLRQLLHEVHDGIHLGILYRNMPEGMRWK